jgi:6-phosphogluconolactonase
MNVNVFDRAQLACQRASAFVAESARAAVRERGRFLLALSGGETPGPMLVALAGEDVPWHATHVFQTDERVAPAGDAERNRTQLEHLLLAHVAIPAPQLHFMPVEGGDLEAAARDYAATLTALAGSPAVLDLVHLGLGADGHTASLVPGDSALDVQDADVAVTAVYRGRRRMTLTLPLLARSRSLLWLVTGATKSDALARVVAGNTTFPAGRVERARATIFADNAAALLLEPTGGPA